MHISEGILSNQILIAGAALSVAGVAMGMRKMDYERIPQVAVLSSAFFVASLVHVPIGPSSAHLILNGLAGVILGWAVFPALLVALFLQAVFFGYGGITALGVNTVVMALPGVVCYYLFGSIIRNGKTANAFVLGFLVGMSGVILGAVLLGVSLIASSENFIAVVKLILLANAPVIILEGLITGGIVAFLKKVKPELLNISYVREETGKVYA